MTAEHLALCVVVAVPGCESTTGAVDRRAGWARPASITRGQGVSAPDRYAWR